MERPFLEHWDHLWALELRRKTGDFNGQGLAMVLQFMQDISYEEFLNHARETTTIIEIAKFYDNPLRTADDLASLMTSMQANYFHAEAFTYGVYFAAWIKTEVAASKRVFKHCDG